MLGKRFSVDIVLELARALGADAAVQLLLPEGQRSNLEKWASLRREAYEILVFDGPTVAGQAVLSSLIADALKSGALSVDDWNYTDHQLIQVLQSMSPKAKDRLQRDFLGPLPELRLLAHIKDTTHPIFRESRASIANLIENYLRKSNIERPYGYCLRDSGTFEKHIAAIDPVTGLTWSVGDRSDSLVLYGFGRGGRKRLPNDLGREFISWYANNTC